MKTLFSIIIFSLLAVAQQTRQERIVICTDAGASDTYACTPTPAVTSYTTGLRVRLYPNTANTGAATVNISAVGAQTIVKVGGGITTALADNDIRVGQYVELVYDGTNFQMLSQLGNAASGGGGAAMVQWGLLGANVVASATNYFQSGGGSSASTAVTNRQGPVSVSGTMSALYMKLSSNQPGDSLVATIMVNGSASALTCTIASGAASCDDLVNTVAVTAGDLLSLKLQNTYASSASGALLGAAVKIQ